MIAPTGLPGDHRQAGPGGGLVVVGLESGGQLRGVDGGKGGPPGGEPPCPWRSALRFFPNRVPAPGDCKALRFFPKRAVSHREIRALQEKAKRAISPGKNKAFRFFPKRLIEGSPGNAFRFFPKRLPGCSPGKAIRKKAKRLPGGSPWGAGWARGPGGCARTPEQGPSRGPEGASCGRQRREVDATEVLRPAPRPASERPAPSPPTSPSPPRRCSPPGP